MYRNSQHDTNTQWEDQRQLLPHWRADRDFLDSNLVYGLALPRKVISTSASRTLGIDQTPIHEIRLIQLMQEGIYDWCLRNLAAGKACYLEMFRSRQEAFFSCSLHRFLKDNRIDFSYCRKLPSKRTSPVILRCGKTANKQAPSWWKMLVDTWYPWFNKLLHQKSWAVSGIWSKKMHFFEPVKLTQPCMRQHIRKLLNLLNHPSRRETSPPQFAVLNETCHHRCIPHWHTVHLELNPRHWHPLRRTNMCSKHSFSARHHHQPSTNLTTWDAKDQPYIWNVTDIQSVNAWMKTKILDATIHTKLDNAASNLLQQMQHVPIGQLPSVTRFLSEWGMEPAQAAKYKEKEATKLLLILDELRKWLCIKCRSLSTLRTTTFSAQERRLLSSVCTWLSHCRSTLFHHTETCFLRIYVVLEHFVSALRLYTFHANHPALFAQLATLGIDPWLSFEQYHSPSQVYARMPMTPNDPMWWYIGSTIHSPLFHELSRLRKYAQLEKGTDAFYEPALRIWHAKKNFFSFFVTPIRIITDDIQLRAQELALIKQFRPKLNHPHCNPLLKRLRISLQQYVLPTSNTGLLGDRLLERFFEEKIPIDRAGLAVLWSRPDELFNILYRLGSNSRDKFEISKLLRTNSSTLPFLYLLYRYCQLIDEPHRTQAKKLLVQVLKFKGGDQPPPNVPMQLPSLSIDTTHMFRDWLREFLQQHSNLFPWFHVPTTQVVHIKNPTWKNKVFNFHRFLKHWDPEQPPPCQCGGHSFFPSQTIRQTGHLFASMLDIFPYTCLAHLNLEDCTWPTSRQWMEQGQQTFYRWKERWKLPNRFKHSWDLALHQAWESHLLQLRHHSSPDVARHRSLNQEIRMMRRFVLCPADHHPHQTFVACPIHYHTLLQKTYFQTDVFEPCTVGSFALRDRLVQLAKQELPTLLHSLINTEGTLPYAYILPKPSKDFEKARPIISYMLSWNAKLGQLFGTLVYELCRSIFGDMQLDRTVQDIIKDIQKIFDDIPNHIELDLQQQDLSGFFNSVPHSRMIEAVTYAVNHYIAHKGVTPDSKLSTSLATEDRTQRIFRGRFRRAGQKYLAIQLDHIPRITEFLLKHSYFTVGNLVFRQIQGASMGSHFAPALCGLVAAFQEYCFHKTFNGMRTQHRLLHNSRYVDNRVLLHFPGWREHYPWNLFTKLDFYEAPILLEEVDDTEILGCTISTTQRTITVRQPKDLVSLRSGLSEDSDLAVISSFRARALLIIRYTYPIPLIFDQLTDLIAIFHQKSVTTDQLKCTQRTLWKFFKHRIPPTKENIRKYGRRMQNLFESFTRQRQRD